MGHFCASGRFCATWISQGRPSLSVSLFIAAIKFSVAIHITDDSVNKGHPGHPTAHTPVHPTPLGPRFCVYVRVWFREDKFRFCFPPLSPVMVVLAARCRIESLIVRVGSTPPCYASVISNIRSEGGIDCICQLCANFSYTIPFLFGELTGSVIGNFEVWPTCRNLRLYIYKIAGGSNNFFLVRTIQRFEPTQWDICVFERDARCLVNISILFFGNFGTRRQYSMQSERRSRLGISVICLEGNITKTTLSKCR